MSIYRARLRITPLMRSLRSIAPCMVLQTTLKRSCMDHTVLPTINTIPAVYLVSIHQMAPPLIEVANI